MNVTTLQYPEPLVPSETWNITDATKLKSFIACPRKYFFEYVLGWRGEEPNLNFEFGTAWHRAMEVLLKRYKSKPAGTRPAYDTEDIKAAYKEFLDYYRQFYPPDMDSVNFPKSPDKAAEALLEYTNRYKDDSFEVLYTEVAGSVFVNETDLLYFCIDLLMKDQDGVSVMDHKTSGIDAKHYREAWQLDIQMFGYSHVLFSMFPEHEVFGAKVNMTFLRKKDVDFVRLQVRKTPDMMAAWLWDTQYYFESLKFNFEALSKCSADAPVMEAFPKVPTSCTAYNHLCPMFAFCQAWPNPLARCGQAPPGMKVFHWNPQDREKAADWILGSDGVLVEQKAPLHAATAQGAQEVDGNDANND